jgi:hypothetical protein
MTITTRSHITQLPPEIVGNILQFIDVWTGSDNLINEADLRPSFRSALQLSLACKTLYRQIHSAPCMDVWFSSLGRTYKKSPEHFLTLWQSPNYEKYLRHRITQNGDQETFDALTSIQDTLSLIEAEAKNAKMIKPQEELRLDENPSSFHFYRTNSGINLSCQSHLFLATPFGKIDIQTKTGNPIPSQIRAAIISRLSASLLDIEEISYEKPPRVYKVPIPPSLEQKIQLPPTFLSRDQALEDQGTTGTLWVVTGPHTVTYQVHCSTTKKNKEPLINSSFKGERSKEIVEHIWKILKGTDITKTIPQKPLQVPQHPQRFTSLDATWRGCTEITQMLFWPPPSKERPNQLTFDSQEQALTVMILHNIYCSHAGEANSSISFSDTPLALITKQESPREIAITPIENSYQQSLAALGKGWKKALVKDHNRVLNTRSEEDHFLLIKETPFFREYELWNALLPQFGLENQISIHQFPDSLYLWIPKKKFEEVCRRYALEIENS